MCPIVKCFRFGMPFENGTNSLDFQMEQIQHGHHFVQKDLKTGQDGPFSNGI